MIKCSEVHLPVGGHSKFDAKGSWTNWWMWFQMRVLGSLDVFSRLLSWMQDQCQLLYCQQNPSWRSTEVSVCAFIIWSWSIVLLGPIELITSLLQNVTNCTSLEPILWRDTVGWSAVSGQAVAWMPRLTKEKWTSAGGTAVVQRFLVLHDLRTTLVSHVDILWWHRQFWLEFVLVMFCSWSKYSAYFSQTWTFHPPRIRLRYYKSFDWFVLKIRIDTLQT